MKNIKIMFNYCILDLEIKVEDEVVESIQKNVDL